ncbi:hypothetical protein Gasu2_65190 [Galdieria sulphuraria]|uniref:Uncharacterized protein n=1 Tax=Galdieria sulphuraria TaxID=130081 RepID=M2W5N6_GALSU|nr:uncharacterized protein Gasu_15990 [Galdieria sulphuraria]EME31096.1 hypothetical protein Gasu_15990 [Galdieria sulphuraria]GJD12436.1 hypothetical protein Gasu2_65190 [Galdieria sulphuraria]|eukprot:XP_005707616.1 hypothetical protein Gasu_15990 [Galdieria sulphuraria]
MGSTYWCRWNGKTWEPFLLQPLTQSFVCSNEGQETSPYFCVENNNVDINYEQDLEKKGFHDGYLAGCLQTSSGGNAQLPIEQHELTESLSHFSPNINLEDKSVRFVNKSYRSGMKTKSKRKLQNEWKKKTNRGYSPSSSESVHCDSLLQLPFNLLETERVQQEVQELEASIDAEFVKVVRERTPPLWPILGLNLAYSES